MPRAYLSFTEHYIEQNREPYICDTPPIEVNKEYPATLDLRQTWSKRNK
jgi:hypothetical protein